MQFLHFVLFAVGVTGLRNVRTDADGPGGDEYITLNKYPANWPYLGHCVRPSGEGGLYDYTVKECLGDEPPPFEKNSKIAIVGGGPAGVSMARLLHDRGYTELTLYEKNSRLGGKSKNYVTASGEQHDLGTCYTAGKYECIEAWMNDMKLTENVIKVDRLLTSETTLSPEGGMLTDGKYASINYWMAMKAFMRQRAQSDFSAFAESFLGKFMQAARGYAKAWYATMRSPEYMFPLNPDFEALNQTFLSWLQGRNLEILVPRLHFSTGGQGYGQLDTMPAYYGLTWNHPNILSGYGQQGMVKEGYEELWARLLKDTNVDVRLGQNIAKIKRSRGWFGRDKVRITTSEETDGYDFLIMAAPMPDSLAFLDYTSTEKDLFGSYYTHELTATMVQLEDTDKSILPDNFTLFSFADRLNAQTDIAKRTFDANKKSVSIKMTDQIDGVDGPMTVRNTFNIKGFKERIVGTLQVSNIEKSDDELKKLVVDDLKKWDLPGHVVHQERWTTYLPHLSLEEIITEKKPWKIWKNQGQRNTWFVGSYVSFESVADVLDYNIQLVNTHLCTM